MFKNQGNTMNNKTEKCKSCTAEIYWMFIKADMPYATVQQLASSGNLLRTIG